LCDRSSQVLVIPDGLAERLDQWQVRLPHSGSVYPWYHGFEPYSYTAMLMGLGGLPVQPPPALRLIDPTNARQELDRLRDQAKDLVARRPTQYEYFAHLHGLESATVS
jgi:tryptophan halogenase